MRNQLINTVQWYKIIKDGRSVIYISDNRSNQALVMTFLCRLLKFKPLLILNRTKLYKNKHIGKHKFSWYSLIIWPLVYFFHHFQFSKSQPDSCKKTKLYKRILYTIVISLIYYNFKRNLFIKIFTLKVKL